MSDDDYIYGICRDPECHYIWHKEPEEPVTCPSCGNTGWPMTPAEAEARVRRWYRVGRPCPKPECTGTLKVCEQCSEGQERRQLECNYCGQHVAETGRRFPTKKSETFADQLGQPFDEWVNEQRVDEQRKDEAKMEVEQLERAQRAIEEREHEDARRREKWSNDAR